VLENAPVERLEPPAVVEVAQVRELVTQGVDEARVLEGASGTRVAQADADRPVRVADAEAPPHVRALGLERPIPQAECDGDAAGVALEPCHHFAETLAQAPAESPARFPARPAARPSARPAAQTSAQTSTETVAGHRAPQARNGAILPSAPARVKRARGYDRLVAVAARLESLPLFPLSTVVLFPLVRAPLHVFEPRYRRMTEDALEGARMIGMATVRPEHVGAMAGDPPLFDVGCAGSIERAVRRDDGCYDLVLLGAQRFRIVEEPPGRETPYRIAQVELLEEPFDAGQEGIPLQGLRADAIDLLSELMRLVSPKGAAPLDPRRFSGVEDVPFVNALCQLLDLSPLEKQGLLEARGPLERCDRLVALLRFRIAELGGGLSGSFDTLH
jgi:Lon protease-like protein